jgi:deoxyribonuclease V
VAVSAPLAPVAFTDVHYEGAGARAAAIVAGAWTDAEPIDEAVVTLPAVSPYRPGHFFERELPCLLRVLGALASSPACVVVDGYVVLDAAGAPGLGAHLHEALGRAVPVVGVAKTSFRGSAFAAAVTRGASKTLLYVTAAGVTPALAAKLVLAMHGRFRIPTLLTRVDHLARGLVTDPARARRGP